jgi:glutathione synthase/RimK-type ligase-like ATP-grasp enzyme
LLVGLDVIGNFLTEVNVTSPTCFQEIMQQTGFSTSPRCSSTRWSARRDGLMH